VGMGATGSTFAFLTASYPGGFGVDTPSHAQGWGLLGGSGMQRRLQNATLFRFNEF
jgi:hypothetical protein